MPEFAFVAAASATATAATLVVLLMVPLLLAGASPGQFCPFAGESFRPKTTTITRVHGGEVVGFSAMWQRHRVNFLYL